MAVSTVLFMWQKNNIMSVATALRYSKQELTEKINKNKRVAEIQVEEHGGSVIRDFSHEEEEEIRRGETTPEEALKLLNEQNDEIETDESLNSVSDLIKQSTEQLYLLKATYIGKLGSLERQAKSDYAAFLKEKKGATEKNKLIASYIKKVAALESECDGAVSEILKKLELGLKEQGADTKIVKTMKKAYEDEKILKKSYFLSQYK